MSLILKPGDPPPLIPYCQLCDQPVDRYQMDLITKDRGDVIGIHAQCCNQTSSTRITVAAYQELMATPRAKLYVIVRKGSQAGIRARKQGLRSISH